VIVASIAFGALILGRAAKIQPYRDPHDDQGIILFSLIASEVALRLPRRLSGGSTDGSHASSWAAGVASGTVLLFAAVGEIFAEAGRGATWASRG